MTSCEDEEVEPDRLITIDFGWPFFGHLPTVDEAGYFNDIKTSLLKFKIENYPGVDSVSFGAYMYTSDPNTKCIVELFNKTDNTVIASSIITTNQTTETFVETTKNFVNEFPKKEIVLGMRVRTEKQGVYVSMVKPLLFLYRRPKYKQSI